MRAPAMSLLTTMCLLAPMASAQATTLTGSVSFDNGLYTYNYALSAADTPVTEVLVMINSLGFTSWDLMPVSSTSPAGCQFHLYSGPLFGQPPGGEFRSASFWGWDCPLNGTAALDGFSFTTTHAPAANPYPYNAALFRPAYSGGTPPYEAFEFGQVIAPDLLLVPTVPEPSMALSLIAGLALLAGVAAGSRARRHP